MAHASAGIRLGITLQPVDGKTPEQLPVISGKVGTILKGKERELKAVKGSDGSML